MTARRDLYAALMAGGPHSPERSEKASALIDAVLAEEFHQAADEIDRAQNRLVVKKTVVNILRRRANRVGEATAEGAATQGALPMPAGPLVSVDKDATGMTLTFTTGGDAS